MQKFKNIIFDCDGVLINSEILANRAEVEVKRQLGFPITIEEQITKFVGCGMNHPDMVAEIARLPAAYVQMVDDRCAEIYKTDLRAIDGVFATLEALRVPICVASSSEPDSLDYKLKLTKLKSFFPDPAVFHGKTVERCKPKPDIFLNALSKMGWKAEETLVVEDSFAGVTAGKAAGMTVVAFLGGEHIYPGHADRVLKAGADYLIQDLRKILALVQ